MLGGILMCVISFGGLIYLIWLIKAGVDGAIGDKNYENNKAYYDNKEVEYKKTVDRLESEYKVMFAELAKNWKDLKPNFRIDKIDDYCIYIARNKINDTLSSIEKTQILMAERIAKIEDNMTKEG